MHGIPRSSALARRGLMLVLALGLLLVARPAPATDPGPSLDGEQIRRWTRVTDAELNALDPSFREWANLIRSGRADRRIMRLYSFYKSRLEPFDRLIPEGWRERGLAVLRNEERNRKMIEQGASSMGIDSSESTSTSGPGIPLHGVWLPIGPSNVPGRMTGLARPEGEPLTLYASAADGGVWRTRDGGDTWVSLSDFEATLSGGAILLDPVDPDILYFGTGEGNEAGDNYNGIGVLKSTDGGKTWTPSNHFSDDVRALATHPSRRHRIYAAGDEGCYVSEDSGATFDLIDPGTGLPTGRRASTVLIHPDDPDRVYCAIWDGEHSGVFRTNDGGVSWSPVNNGLPDGNKGRISMAISASHPDVLIAGLSVDNGRVYRTENGGDTWTALDGAHVGYCSGQCWYDNIVAIDSDDPGVLYAGGIGIYRSLDAGATWQYVSAGVYVDQHAFLTPAPGEVIAANDGGIYRSTDHGYIWENRGVGLETSQFYGICRHPADDYWAFGGTQDQGSLRRYATDDPEWQRRLGSDGGMCMTGPSGSQVVLGEGQYLQINRSIDDGYSFAWGGDGIDENDPRPWIGILVADPTDRNNMWAGTHRVYRTLDAKATPWEPVSEILHAGFNVRAIEVAPSDSRTVYVGFEAGGLYRSTRALAKSPPWVDISQSYLPSRTVRRIRAHPADEDTVYVVYAGYGSGKIWKTTDGGGTWVDHTGDLPDVPVNDLVLDPANDGTILAATDLGVFRTDDDGATWYGFSTGLPTAAAVEFTYDDVGGTLRVGTHGRSMWEWQAASDTPTAVPDGATVSGTPMTVERIGASEMRLHWDVRTCTAQDYNLLYGDLADVATRAYSGAECGLGTSGRADVPLPATVSGDAFFVIVATDGAGAEGPHGFDSLGDPVPADGIGFCGITEQIDTATCP